MKKALLVYAISYKIQSTLLGIAAPSGLSWVAKGLRIRGYDSQICDLSFASSPEEVEQILIDAINEYQPDVIGMSIRNIDTASTPPKTFYPFLESVATTIKANSDVPLVLGGSGFSLYPDECMRRMKADYGLVGEGEKSFPDLLDGIFSGSDVTRLPGLYMNNKGLPVANPRDMFQEFTEIGQPIHDGIDYDRYEEIGGYYSVQTKRGCAFKCVYCDYPFLEGKKYRMRDPIDIVDEMENLLSKYKLKHFFFTDSVFNFPVKLCESILQEIVNRGLDLQWAAYVNPRGMTREMVQLFKDSGCSRVEVTIDTASEQTLASYQKHFGVEEILQADEYLHEAGIPTYYWINVGGPGETQETLTEGFETLHKLKGVTKGWVGGGFIVHPGTPLYDIAKNEGMIDDLTGGEPFLYLSKDLPDDFSEQIQEFCRDHPNWYSIYDRLNPDYMTLFKEIIKGKIRDHWPMQEAYGLKRKQKYINGELDIVSYEEFQNRISKLGAHGKKVK